MSKTPIFPRMCTLLLVVLITIGAAFVAVPIPANSNMKVLIDASHGNAHASTAELAPFLTLLKQWGYQGVTAVGGVNNSILSDVDVYVAAMPGRDYAADEVAALTAWFALGGKAVWLASDSDFTTAAGIPGPLYQNALLAALGSKLRFEPSSVESPTLNIGGAAYRVLTPIMNRDTAAAMLTENVRVGFFHGPTLLAGYDGSNYVALETTSLENVVWLAKTASDGVIVETDPTYLANAHIAGQKGTFVMAAAETVGTNKVVATGEAIFTDYKSMISYPGEKNSPQDDRQLVINTFAWFIPTLANTEFRVTAPESLIQGQMGTFTARYTTFGHTAENLAASVTAYVPQATITGSIDSTPLDFVIGAPPACIYTATETGTFEWQVSASAENFKTQTATGSLTVTPRPTTTSTTTTTTTQPTTTTTTPPVPVLPVALAGSISSVLFAVRHIRSRRRK